MTDQIGPDNLGWPPLPCFLIGAAIAASALESSRIGIAGFAVHPYLVVIALGVVFLSTRWERPTLQWASTLALTSLVLAAFSVASELNLVDSVKFLAVAFTIRFLPVVIRSEQAVRSAMLGFVSVLFVIVTLAIQAGERGLNGEILAFSSGNKNITALYVVPAVAFCIALLRRRDTSTLLRVGLISSTLAFTWLAINSGNRAAFVGLAFVFLGPALLSDGVGSTTQRLRRGAWLLSGLFGASILVSTGPAVFVDRLFGRSFNSTGQLRIEIVSATAELFGRSPLFGYGPDGFRQELATELNSPLGLDAIEAHNLYIFLAGSFGFVGVVSGFAVARALLRSASNVRLRNPLLGKTAVLLFGVQSLFTSEVIFAPPFLLLLILGLVVSSEATPHIERPQYSIADSNPHHERSQP